MLKYSFEQLSKMNIFDALDLVIKMSDQERESVIKSMPIHLR